MKIVFYCLHYEHIGIEYLSAVLKKAGHQTSLLFDPQLFDSFLIKNNFLDKLFDYSEELINQVVNSNNDLICFSTTSPYYSLACQVAKKIKERKNIPIVFGGMHPTLVPELVIREPFIDYICLGEGEHALLDLVNMLEGGRQTTNIENIWGKESNRIIKNTLRAPEKCLDKFPFPDKDLFYNEYRDFSSVYLIFSGRGCPLSCSFCYSALLRHLYENKGSFVRKRSVDNVIEELIAAKHKHKISKVCFLDDIFIYDIQWLRDFSVQYRSVVKLPFSCHVSPLFVNEETVDLLSLAGCSTVCMGVQTISENIRKEYMHRNETNEQVRLAIRLFKERKIFLQIDIMLGFCGQNKNELLDIATFFNRNKPNTLCVFPLDYLPKTEIVEIERKKGLLTDTDIGRIEHGDGNLIDCFRNKFKKNEVKELSKIANLIIISPLVPKFLMSFMIKNRLYRYFLGFNVYFNWGFNWLMIVYSRLFRLVKRLAWISHFFVLRFFIHYMVKRFSRFMNVTSVCKKSTKL